MGLKEELNEELTKTAIEEAVNFALKNNVPKDILIKFLNIIKTSIKKNEVYFAFIKNDIPTVFKTDIENIEILDSKKVKDMKISGIFETIEAVLNDIPNDQKQLPKRTNLTDLEVVSDEKETKE